MTEQDFWNAAYDFDRLNGDPSQLFNIIRYGKLGLITIGRLDGRHTMKIRPGCGGLPLDDDAVLDAGLSPASNGAEAIKFPEAPAFKGSRSLTPTPESKGTIFKDANDNILRRYEILGRVVMWSDRKHWDLTGHVLVMDMGDRESRRRQPWLILASEWPTDHWNVQIDNFDTYAQDRVCNLPGHDREITIGRIEPLEESAGDDIPILRRLGEDFEFKLVPPEAHNHMLYPPLVETMNWYWDPETRQEVCFTKDGREYMRYNPEKKEYTYSNHAEQGSDLKNEPEQATTESGREE